MSSATPPGGQPEYSQPNPKADAKAARAYYKASRPWYKKKRFMIPLVFVVIIALGSAFGGGDDGAGSDSDNTTASDKSSEASKPKAEKKETAPTKKATPKPEPKAKAMMVKAGAMLEEFDGNEAAADAKYKGKTLRVTGIVDKVDTDMLNDDEYIIRLAGGGEFVILTVNCNGIPASVAAKINKGEKTSVIGKFDDGGDLGVELKDCALA